MRIVTFLIFQRIRIVRVDFLNQLFDFLIGYVKMIVGNQTIGIYHPMEVFSIEEERKEFE